MSKAATEGNILEYLQNRKIEPQNLEIFKDATDFENKVSGINLHKLSKLNDHSRLYYQAELVDLKNDTKLKFVNDAIEVVPPLKEEIKKKLDEGSKVKVMTYNTNHHVFYKNIPIFKADKYYKVDTFVDFYYKDKETGQYIKFDKNLIIEEKFYAHSYQAKTITQEKTPYYAEHNTELEKKTFNIERKRIVEELRVLKEKISKFENSIEKNKDLYSKKDLKLANLKIQEFEDDRQKLKNLLSNDTDIKKYINARLPNSVGVPVEITKFGLPENYKEIKSEKNKEALKVIKDKASGAAGNYRLIDGITTPILDKNGNIKSRSGKLPVGTGEKYIGKNKFGKKKEMEKEKIIDLGEYNNSNAFANRYVTGILAVNDGVYVDWIKDNLDLENFRMGKTAYGGKKKPSTSVKLNYSELTPIMERSMKETNDIIDYQTKLLAKKEKKYIKK